MQEKERERKRQKVFESKISYRKGLSSSIFDPNSIVLTQLQLIVIEPGSLETRLCSRSNHRIYVAWSVKGSAAAWGAHLIAPIHLCPTKYRDIAPTVCTSQRRPLDIKGQAFCRHSREITADIIQSYLCSLNPIYMHVGKDSWMNFGERYLSTSFGTRVQYENYFWHIKLNIQYKYTRHFSIYIQIILRVYYSLCMIERNFTF